MLFYVLTAVKSALTYLIVAKSKHITDITPIANHLKYDDFMSLLCFTVKTQRRQLQLWLYSLAEMGSLWMWIWICSQNLNVRQCHKQTKIATETENKAAVAFRVAASVTSRWARSIWLLSEPTPTSRLHLNTLDGDRTQHCQPRTESQSAASEPVNKQPYCINVFWQAVIVHQALPGWVQHSAWLSRSKYCLKVLQWHPACHPPKPQQSSP